MQQLLSRLPGRIWPARPHGARDARLRRGARYVPANRRVGYPTLRAIRPLPRQRREALNAACRSVARVERARSRCGCGRTVPSETRGGCEDVRVSPRVSARTTAVRLCARQAPRPRLQRQPLPEREEIRPRLFLEHIEPLADVADLEVIGADAF